MWDKFLKLEKEKTYYKNLEEKLNIERQNYTIYPDKKDTFNAFSFCSFENLKVVIIGQDPYHTPNTADGLSFSSKSKKIPQSLKNIYKLLYQDLKIKRENPSLKDWALQGVFLINTYLTVRENKPLSHKNLGWDILVKNAIKYISDNKEHVVFVLWGNFSINNFQSLIDPKKHLIITSSHPSPFSAHISFFTSKAFIKINNFLNKNKLDSIVW